MNAMQEGKTSCKRNNVRADEQKQLSVARTKQQEEEEVTSIRPVGRENKGIQINKAIQMNKASKTTRDEPDEDNGRSAGKRQRPGAVACAKPSSGGEAPACMGHSH